jgi:hypothetical protein
MNSKVSANLAAHGHDARLYIVLGLANWSIFVDHIPNNAVNLLTLRNFGFSGAVDLFVFVAGYAAAIVYGRMMLERGFVVGSTRIFGRVWRLYAAYVVLFVVYIDAIAYVATQSAAAEIIHEYNLSGMIDHPVRILVRGLLLQTQPLNLDIIELFIPLLAFFPLALWGLLRRPNLTLIASIALYVAARQFGWNLPAFPDGFWRLNPFCWQLLMVLGAWFALTSTADRPAYRPPWLRIAAIVYLSFALVITMASRSSELGSLLPDFPVGAFMPSDRENLGPYRVLHFLALAYLFTQMVPRDRRGLHSKLLRPAIKCGEQWLAVFCVGVFLSFAGHLILITGPNLLVMQILVSLVGVAAMTGVAYYVSWSKRQDHPWAVRQQI